MNDTTDLIPFEQHDNDDVQPAEDGSSVQGAELPLATMQQGDLVIEEQHCEVTEVTVSQTTIIEMEYEMQIDDFTITFDPQEHGSTRGAVKVEKNGSVHHIDTINLSKAADRSKFTTALAATCQDFNEDTAGIELNNWMMGKATTQSALIANNGNEALQEQHIRPLEQSAAVLTSTPTDLRERAEAFLKAPNLIERILDDIHAIGVVGEKELALATYLLGTSRLLDKPLAAIVMGASSAGKSFVLQKVAKLFPAEAVLQAHRMSPQALLYKENGSLVHLFIVAGERSQRRDDGAADATRNWREMVSDGRISADIVVKSPSGGHKTKHIEQDGPIAYIESTTMNKIFNEDRTRLILLSVDESKGQTEAILLGTAQAAASSSEVQAHDDMINLHHTAQRLLKSAHVVIPFAKDMVGHVDTNKLDARRRYPHMLGFVKAVALLHQFQRDQNDQGDIIASEEDYNIVTGHLGGILQRAVESSVDNGTRQLWSVIQTSFPDSFTATQAIAKSGYSEGKARQGLRKLKTGGQIVVKAEGSGPNPVEYAIANNPPPLGGINLPLGSEICTSDTDANLVSASTSEEAEEADETTA